MKKPLEILCCLVAVLVACILIQTFFPLALVSHSDYGEKIGGGLYRFHDIEAGKFIYRDVRGGLAVTEDK